jgi:hypothetical protein
VNTRNPTLIRYVGLAGSVALAIDAYLFGARLTIPLHVTPQSVATGRNGVLIMTLWLGGTGAMVWAWLSGLRALTSLRRTIVTIVLWTLPMLVIPPLASRDMYAYSCQGALWNAGLNPYTHGVSDLPCPWLDTVSVVWRDTPTPYGPLFVLLTGGAASTGSLTAAIAVFRALAVLGVIVIGLSLPPLTRRLGLPAERALWLVLACPLAVIHLVGGGHNDALTIGLLLAAVAMIVTWYRRPAGLITGGALIGLSIAIKPTILVAVPFLALYVTDGTDSQALRSSSGMSPGPRPGGPLGFPAVGALVRQGGTLLVAAFAALLIPTLISGLGFGWANALMHAGGSPSWTSPSTAIGTTIDAVASVFGAHLYVVPATRTVGVVLLIVTLPLIFWRCRWDNRLYGAGLALLAISFYAPIAQPWYLLWPMALFVLTPLRARWFLITTAVGCFVAMPDGVGLDGLLRLPLSMYRGVTWLRGAEPATIDPDNPIPEPSPDSLVESR